MDQQKLKSVLWYDPDSGLFYWLCKGGSASPNKVAGCWTSQGYVKIRINGVLYQAHRLAWLYMTGDWPTQEIDHINRDKADNSWTNLRDVTRSENLLNSDLQVNNLSGFKGVHYCETRQKWISRICREQTNYYVGEFDSPEAAHQARELVLNGSE
jgi:hypothetical protein